MVKYDLLIDADILLYRAASAAQQEVEWEEDMWFIYSDLSEAKLIFQAQLNQIMDEAEGFDIGNMYLCFSDRLNFRKAVDPTYKSGRGRKPVGFGPLRESIIEERAGVCCIMPWLEADDTMGILATRYPGKYVISSIDKDLKQIPGKHLVNGRIITVGPEEADVWFYTQVLTGDSTDGYPGCPGIGPKKAEAILNKPEDAWTLIVDAYTKAGLTEEDAIKQARLARILRDSDFDFDRNEVVLWTPR